MAVVAPELEPEPGTSIQGQLFHQPISSYGFESGDLSGWDSSN